MVILIKDTVRSCWTIRDVMIYVKQFNKGYRVFINGTIMLPLSYQLFLYSSSIVVGGAWSLFRQLRRQCHIIQPHTAPPAGRL